MSAVCCLTDPRPAPVVWYLDLRGGLRVDPKDPRSARKRVVFPALFVSDFHVYTRTCLARDARNFIKAVEMQKLYLAGDAVDYLYKSKIDAKEQVQFFLKHRNHPQVKLIKTITGLPEEEVVVKFALGNHERALAGLIGETSDDNSIEIGESFVHETAKGERCLVLHGDIFDSDVRFHRFWELVGTHAYEKLSALSVFLDRCGKNPKVRGLADALGAAPPWSLAQQIKTRVDGMTYHALFKQAALEHVFRINKKIYDKHKREGTLDQARYITYIICGHTHIPERFEAESPRDAEGRSIGPAKVIGFNDGCWMGPPDCAEGDDAWRDTCYPPPCTAVAELPSGDLDLVLYDPRRGISSYAPPPQPTKLVWAS